MTRLGLISDVHASPEAVAQALSIFAQAGVDAIYCAGDIAGYNNGLLPTIKLLRQSQCLCVAGNHDLLYLDHHDDDSGQEACNASRYLKQLPLYYQQWIDNKNLYMVHAQPPDSCHGGIKLLDRYGRLLVDKVQLWSKKLAGFEADVLVVGHTHQVYAEWLGDTFVVNPGSTVFNHSCAILSLPAMHVEWFPLGGLAIKTTWNWGEHMVYSGSGLKSR